MGAMTVPSPATTRERRTGEADRLDAVASGTLRSRTYRVGDGTEVATSRESTCGTLSARCSMRRVARRGSEARIPCDGTSDSARSASKKAIGEGARCTRRVERVGGAAIDGPVAVRVGANAAGAMVRRPERVATGCTCDAPATGRVSEPRARRAARATPCTERRSGLGSGTADAGTRRRDGCSTDSASTESCAMY